MNILNTNAHTVKSKISAKMILACLAVVAVALYGRYHKCLDCILLMVIGLLIGWCIFPQLLNHHTTKYSPQNEESQAALILKMKAQLRHDERIITALLGEPFNRSMVLRKYAGKDLNVWHFIQEAK